MTLSITDDEIRQFWPEDDPAEIRRQLEVTVRYLEEQRSVPPVLEWNLDMSAAPRRVLLCMARLPYARSGFPVFLMPDGNDRWLQPTPLGHPEIEMLPWAWIDREILPPWPEEPWEHRSRP